MGAYLSKPVTEKEFERGEDARLSFEAGSMQGWRTNQEDAHSCILDFTEDISLFAVYDGHGGAEVAQLCSDRLPKFIKESEQFSKGNFPGALVDSFLAFDDAITSLEIQDVLKNLANKDDNKSDDNDEDEDDDPNLLQEEAELPLAQLLRKYKFSMMENGSEEGSDEGHIVEDTNKHATESSTNNSDSENMKKVTEISDETAEDDEDEEFIVGDEEEDEDEGDTEDESDDDNDCVREMGSKIQDMQYLHSSPGFDSGSTAVVALIDKAEGKIYVANAGDSRCILCRSGHAFDLSIDHKPEDPIEIERIKKAGGALTEDGRVNGGLNLSRSIGDHSYKQNKELLLKDQMISALPDVKIVDFKPTEDEFMVLACDGIWNTFSSDELIEFIKSRISGGMTMNEMISEIFNHCLAPNTTGDGTGCDNMTCIIVMFKAFKPESSALCNGRVELSKRKSDNSDEATPKKLTKVYQS